MYRKVFLLMLLVLPVIKSTAQTDSLKWVTEINKQVWKPFTACIITGDDSLMRTLHSKRITRVEIDDNKIMDYNKYFPPPVTKKSWPQQEGVSRFFELRFDKRISDGRKAWESGYYKGAVLKEGKELRSYYGRFYVVLEKENGQWKILVDADTKENATIENFNKTSPMGTD